MLCPFLLDLSVTLSESVFQINLITPHRSTIAINSLARFLAKCHVEDIPEESLELMSRKRNQLFSVLDQTRTIKFKRLWKWQGTPIAIKQGNH